MFCYRLCRPALLMVLTVLFCLPSFNVNSQATLDAPHDTGFGSGCLTCHDMAAYDQPGLIPGNGHTPQHIDDSLYNNVCWGCHDGVTATGVLTHSSLQTDNGYGDWSMDCSVCHSQHTQEQERIYGATYGKFIRTRIDLSKISGLVKNGYKDVKFTGNTGLNSFADGDATIDGICEVCHTQTTHFRNDGNGSDQLHLNIGAVAGTNCMDCHKHSEGFIGNGHNETHFRWDGGCNNCHGAGSGVEAVVGEIHDNKCDLCHTTGGPYDASTNKTGANGYGDATLAEGDAGTWTSTCVTCHNKTQVPGFHGLTLVEVSPVHENLGSSRGSWADSGGTIPSTRAAGYNGKIDTANALLDDDYNCADCHDLERTGFTPLEALEVHLFESGRGNGNCTTCHRASMVADEITSGIGGSTIECEDCHSFANGNGPSGEKMYQYDGIRHHKTLHAQAGNCTMCHADPRPADLSAEPGYAGTAAVNDGSDGDGMTWNDGFDEDFNINYTHSGGMPTQMGCRLCHTNYQVYKVDVKASGNANWTTDEDADMHGYNIGNHDSGLTVYTNNFDARNTSLAYLDALADVTIQGAAQTSQVSIPSHRIEAVNGSSKINVFNYGACFACHTVQIRHASPIPAQDYDTPVAGYDAAAMNTYTYDTLRYAPGRSVFNDFRGSGPPGDAWNNHTKDTGSFPYWLADWEKRPSTVFNSGTVFFGDIANDSLATVPVNTNVNDLENLPGMTGPSTIRNFDTGPPSPDFDEITITVAQWTGSAVYVEASSSIGSGQNFTFTYTGAGGPCNTSMTWNIDHYEGTCMAASGYEGTDSVTVYNNTTSAPDEQTRSLTDLTINPSAPTLTSMTLSDNNNADPTPAEAGYTNSHSVAVTLTVSNYPTHVMFSEEPGFSSNSGWLLFDATVNYTLQDLGPPPSGEGIRTIYAKVKNGAGESGARSNTIILDTVNPAIQANTLTTPNGHTQGWKAEFWNVGSSQTIIWVAGDITDTHLKANPIFLKESYHSGDTWRVLYIAQNEANDGSFVWTVAGSPITTARIRLEARDKAGNAATDASDNDYNKSTPYIVTNTSDALVAGSLRQVLTDLIAVGGNSSIWFNIPDTDPNIVDGVAIISPATNLPTINQDDIYIEGDTQSALRGNTNSKGPEIRINKAGTSTIGFTISGGVLNQIRALQITGFTTGVSSSGSNTVLEGNHIGFASGDSSGYTSVPNANGAVLSDNSPVIARNYFGCASIIGLDLTNSSSATVDGNIFGVFPDPTDPAIPASPADKCIVSGTLAIGSDAILVGGSADSADISNNIISGANNGIYLGGSSANTTITGNQIGTFFDNDDGWVTAVGPGNGVYLNTTGGGNIIGGTHVATTDVDLNDSNVIAPYNPDFWQPYRTGIYINDALDYSTWVYGNFIGTNPECDPVNNRGACEVFRGHVGINIYFAEGVTIGGEVDTNPPCQSGNVIANMNGTGLGDYGVKVSQAPSKNVKLNCNTFFDNGDGSLDDAFFQSYATPTPSRPVITNADTNTVRITNISGGNGTTQQGDIVEIYLADFDGTEYGEGVKLVGSTQATFGQTSVDVDISGAGLSAGDWVTATRTSHYTGSRYQTSPFCTNLKITGTTTAPSLNWLGTGNYVADGVDPNSAPVDSSFTFQVEYTDTDGAFGDPPQIIEVWIDKDDDGSYHESEKFAMTEVNPADTNYTDGKLFEHVIALDIWSTLVDGIINYRFYASDGSFYTVTGDPAYPLLDDTNTVEVTN